MSELLRAFGVLTLISGVIIAGILVVTPWVQTGRVPFDAGLAALVLVVGSAFWAALCITVADTNKAVRELRAELRGATEPARRVESRPVAPPR